MKIMKAVAENGMVIHLNIKIGDNKRNGLCLNPPNLKTINIR